MAFPERTPSLTTILNQEPAPVDVQDFCRHVLNLLGSAGVMLAGVGTGTGSTLDGNANALAIGGQIGGFTANPSITFTRPADTTAYASGDLVANSTTAGSVTPMSFSVGRVAAGSFTIRKARLRKTTTTTSNAGFRLHLYTSSPTVTNGDNGAWLSNQSAAYVGAVDFAAANALAFSDGAGINGAPLIGSDLNIKLASGQTIFGLLEARGAYAPGSAEQFTVTLEAFQD